MQIHDALDSLLPTVTKPARYSGGEWNSVVKDWDTADVRLALAYPDTYEVGMSNLGLPILYDIVNSQPGMLCERVYAPWVDMESALRSAGLPLYSLESKRALGDFDVIGFTLPHELNYTNVLNMLDLAGVPVWARERDDTHPLIIAGGSGAYNPEPLADFLDLVVIGEGEEVLVELLAAFRDLRRKRRDGPPGLRRAFLERAACIPGVYVPSLYDVTYHDDGTVHQVVPNVPCAAARITKRIVSPLPPVLTRPVVPYVEAIHDRGMVEIMRGCGRGCRFCQAGMIYRPVRERSKDEVLAAVAELLGNTGYSEVALVSLSSTDHSQIQDIVGSLVAHPPRDHTGISLPSLRIDGFSVALAGLLSREKKTGLTFAPEAGSQRLRDVINKQVTEDDLLRTAELAYGQGWHTIKLYFMVGLPTETPEDVEGIVRLARQVLATGRRHHGNRAQLNVSVATFIPKSQTPFQWAAQATAEQLAPEHELLRRGLRGGIHVSWHDPLTALLESVLARGDRRMSRVIYRAWRGGCRLDAWHEHFKWNVWQEALAAEGLDAAFYAHRQRPLDEVLPWDHVDGGVDKAFLVEEYRRAMSGQTTPDCHVDGSCSLCGIRERFAAVC